MSKNLLNELKKTIFEPSKGISVIFSLSIILFGIGKLVYSQEKITVENIFISFMVILSFVYLSFQVLKK